MPTRRFYANSAPQQTLASGITNSATSATIQSSFAGWPASFPFFAVLEAGTANQEIVSVTNIVGLVATIVRGQDGSTAVAHNAGATLDQMVVRQDLDEANAHTSATSGVHGISGHVVGDTDVQTLTNKTLSSPTLTGTLTGSGTIGGSTVINTSGAATAATVNGGSLIAPIQRVFTSSGTYTKPANLRALRVRLVGGGGGGGGATGGAGRAAGAGGGGGGYSEVIIAAGSLGATQAYTVGGGGTAGAGGGANGTAGGTTSFGSFASATGGSGGATGGNTGAATSAAVVSGGTGGVGSLGTINLNGTDGTDGGAVLTASGAFNDPGVGGGTLLGASAVTSSSAGTTGAAGYNYGGGGGGGVASSANVNGGAGAGGVVIVEEIY